MRAKRRIVTSGRPAGSARTPTIRHRRSAIEPARPVAARPTTGAAPAVATAATAPPPTAIDLSVDLGRGLVLANPVLVASGALGYGAEVADAVDLARLGAICTRGTTRKPRTGNPPPRTTETPGGVSPTTAPQGESEWMRQR